MATLSSAVQHTTKMLWEVWGEPALTSAGLYEPQDRTYGRYNIPFSPMEQRLHSNPDVNVWFGKALMPNGKDFTWYQVWEDPKAQLRTGRQADMIFVHGTGVHGGTLASHSRRYLDAGFRVIVPDLPSHGYSTGVHVYQDNLRGYTAGLHAVLHDVARRDDERTNAGLPTPKSLRRDTFMLGLSFGGLVALSYALHYPDSLRSAETGEFEIPIDGIIAVGPMIGYSKTNVTVGPAMEFGIRSLKNLFQLQRLEVFVPHKKCLDKDPKVYKTLVTEDKRSHQGAFRVGHLTALADGMIELRAGAKDIKHPLYIQQGGQDRVVDFENCFDFVRDAASTDKKCAVYPVCQHVIYRKAKTEEEDQAGRVACIEDNVEWMCQRSPGRGSLPRSMSICSIMSDQTIIDDGVPIHPLAMAEPSPSPYPTPSAERGAPPSLCSPGTPSFGHAGAFFDPSRPIPTYDEPESESDDGNASLDSKTEGGSDHGKSQDEEEEEHPLLAKAHPTTLPLLATLVQQRTYRPRWSLHEQLRPYDVPCE